MTSSAAAIPTAPGGRLVAAVATLGAAVLVTGTVLSLQGVDTRDEATTLVAVEAGATLESPAGTRSAVRGAEVPDGAVLRTTTGGAVLRTGSRTVDVAPGSVVVVVDGAHQRLRAGALLVDAVDGDGLRLTTRSVRTRVPDGALVRVEQPRDRSAAARVAAYDGTATVRAPGRRATVEVAELHQVQVRPDAAPGRVRALSLTPGDAWEARELAAVVSDDVDLDGLVRTLVTGGDTVRPAIAAAPAPGGDPSLLRRAERTLSYALAHRGGTDYLDRRDDALQRHRADGGSWGVVVRLAGASSADADSWLARRLGPGQQTLLAAPAGEVDLMGLLPGGGDLPGGPSSGPGPQDGSAPGDRGGEGGDQGGDRGDPDRPGDDPDGPDAPEDDEPGGSGLPSPLGPLVDELLEDLLPSPLPTLPVPGGVLPGVTVGGTVAVPAPTRGPSAGVPALPRAPLAPVSPVVDAVAPALPRAELPVVEAPVEVPAPALPVVRLPGALGLRAAPDQPGLDVPAVR